MDKLESALSMLFSAEDIKRIEFYIAVGIGLYGGYKIYWLYFFRSKKRANGSDEDALIVGVINIVFSIVCLALLIT